MNYNPNNALRDRFLLTIPGHSDVALKVTSSPVPTVSADGISVRGSSDPLMAHLDGDLLTYAPAIWMFTVDEDLENYYKLWEWLVNNTTNQADVRLDGTMSIMDSTGMKVLRRITYEELHPIELGEIDYGIDDDQGVTLTCAVTMRYTKFDVKKTEDTPFVVPPRYYDLSHITDMSIVATITPDSYTIASLNTGPNDNASFSVDENGYLVMDVDTPHQLVVGQRVFMEDGIVYFKSE